MKVDDRAFPLYWPEGPDRGGSTEAMTRLNTAFEAAQRELGGAA